MTKHVNQHSFLHHRAREFRKNPTLAEQTLWQYLKARKLAGLKFRRQHAVGPFIVDFYCHALQLVIEVDGEVHKQQQEYDEQREIWLREQGLRVLRFSNEEVLGNTEMVLEKIVMFAQEFVDLPPSMAGTFGYKKPPRCTPQEGLGEGI